MSFYVENALWRRDESAIAEVRRRVFIEEQAVPEALEWEALDAACDWFVAWHDSKVIGIARLTPDGRIGRMAVLPDWRGRGVGSALLTQVLARARQRRMGGVTLHAQTHAMPFYSRFGFLPEGEVFMEAGIPHQVMRLELQDR